ncbi:DNA-formamidopyrimidine glycosylase [Tichowtungia aerotolerans]|uniref:Formamidopyrimidine-DNA glycosylase n=1 Tax=Tichowtungia aerotolerans TaxID=2697043 RepID=A0A6P1MDS7_9BACT|nr:DNA-formamidopyrimidine glycosylase [Tichowtungia aerotolerans]QHI69746.1 DNA-formamidopyrimidine glycosylase [Tichowtungia aerotolerans]
MPELPEVETIRRQLCAAGICGRIIERISIGWPRTVEPMAPAAFRKKVTGQTIGAVSRHGKWLIFELDDIDNLLVHLRMTGGFYFSEGDLKKGPYDRLVFQLSDGMNLHFRDPRKFGRVRLGIFPLGLGPDAMEITPRPFFQTLEKSNRQLKPLLLDQSFVAGIGNIYADEALFAARLRPDRRSGTLSEDEKQALYYGITNVIRAAVENGGTSLGDGQGNYVDLNGNSGGHQDKANVYGRAGKPCVECGRPLEKTTLAQRTTVFCPHCQK